MVDVLITENITGEPIDALQRGLDVKFEPELWSDLDRLREGVRDVRALIVRNRTQVTAQLMAAAPRLQIIGRAGAGLDNIDTHAATEAGIVVAYAPRENSVSVAELTIGLMLALARKIPAADRDTHAGGWNRSQFMGSELAGKTLGVVGLGRIGTLTAQRAKAFGMTILAHDEFIDPQAGHVRQLAARLVSLKELLRAADIVVCHVPLADQTRAMFNRDRFSLMKPSAIFINTSRGEVVDEAGLIWAIEQNQIAGAALDVRTTEPPRESRLAAMDNVILTPHIAAATHEAQHRVVDAVCHDVEAVLRGEAATNYCNFSTPRKSST